MRCRAAIPEGRSWRHGAPCRPWNGHITALIHSTQNIRPGPRAMRRVDSCVARFAGEAGRHSNSNTASKKRPIWKRDGVHHSIRRSAIDVERVPTFTTLRRIAPSPPPSLKGPAGDPIPQLLAFIFPSSKSFQVSVLVGESTVRFVARASCLSHSSLTCLFLLHSIHEFLFNDHTPVITPTIINMRTSIAVAVALAAASATPAFAAPVSKCVPLRVPAPLTPHASLLQRVDRP